MASCRWTAAEAAVCIDIDGPSVRLLVGGRRVGRDDFDRALDALQHIARAEPLLKAVHTAGGLTSRELADAEGIALTAASMRLKAAYALGLLTRKPEGRNRWRYYVVPGGDSAGAPEPRPVTVASDHVEELQPRDDLPDARSANPDPGTERRDGDARLGVDDLDGAQLAGGQSAAVRGGGEQTVALAAHAAEGATSSEGRGARAPREIGMSQPSEGLNRALAEQTAEAERWREAWRARGRRINGVGEFVADGPWEPVAKVQNRMLHAVVEALEDGYHPQNPSPMHPADFIRQRFPHLLRADDDDVAAEGQKDGGS